MMSNRLTERLWWLKHNFKTWLAGRILDSRLGHEIVQQHLFREVCDRALASGAEVYCIYHDCDIKNCPVGAHDD